MVGFNMSISLLKKMILEVLASESSYKIYFDMDGVLAGFDEAMQQKNIERQQLIDDLFKLTGKTPEELKGVLSGEQTDPVLKSAKKIMRSIKSSEMKTAKQPGFFAGLPVLPGIDSLFSYAVESVGPENVYILTAPIEGSETCESEKRGWIAQNFSVHTGNFICDAEKYRYAAPNHILIDDNTKYIDPWRSAGGIGIHHKSVKNSLSELEKILNHGI
jgi:5'(3')-deoxyribonucleotidase